MDQLEKPEAVGLCLLIGQCHEFLVTKFELYMNLHGLLHRYEQIHKSFFTAGVTGFQDKIHK